jgi:hypothetical protein
MTFLRKYSDVRAWLRSLAKESIHAGLTAALAGAGTTTAEGYFPDACAGLAMDWRQTLAAFFAAAILAAAHRIKRDTAEPGETKPPFAR